MINEQTDVISRVESSRVETFLQKYLNIAKRREGAVGRKK